MNLRHSLRVRLLTGTLVWIFATIAIAGWGLSSLFRDHVEQQFHAALKTHLDQLTANLVIDSAGQPALSAPLSDPRFTKPYGGLYWQIDRLAGPGSTATVGVLRSRSLWDSALAASSDAPADGELHQHRIAGPRGGPLGMIERTVFLDGPPAQRLLLMTAADAQLMNAPVAQLNNTLWLALAVLALGLVIAAAVQVAVGLWPLRRLRAALGAVHERKTQQLEGDFPSEIQPLVADFNAVLTQNTEVVMRARTQAGNLAHALKTPLTVMANAAAIAKNDLALARVVTEQAATAQRQIDYHLKRARAAASINLPGAHTLLAPVTEGLARVMRRVHEARHLELTIAPMADDLTFRGEEQDLHEMLGNLLDNACKWARARIEVRAAMLESTPGKLSITIDDDGPGILAPRRAAMLQRGERDDENAPGSGLGLAIVDDLARLCGGQITLGDSPLGGLRVTLALPATTSALKRQRTTVLASSLSD